VPYVLIAGTVASKPKSNPFPATGKPRVTVELDVDERKYLIVGYANRKSKALSPEIA
jgi:hypothetical protein